MQGQPRVVDLFSGCGGFSLGARATGLTPAVAFDVDPILTSSFGWNHPQTKLVLMDLSAATGGDIEREAGGKVAGVIGGPPCQGFSVIGRRKADDPRRLLVGHFFRLVSELCPTFFVMENVRGLGYSDARHVLVSSLENLPDSYRILSPMILDAAEFGAATRRPRLFVIGYDPARMDTLSPADIDAVKRKPATVRDAITDLSSATMIGNDHGFDVWKIGKENRPSSYAAGLRDAAETFTGHRRTEHTPEVAARFGEIRTGCTDPVGRHRRLDWEAQCPNLRAGTGSDRGRYQSVRPIHPDEPRVITVREAARLQGFPDRFRFHPTVWHSFRMIGNSVSPMIARGILGLISQRMGAKPELQGAA